jgi:cellulose biosynthesis protein BcsQ
MLPFALRRTDAVAEALGTGTTLIEYAPDSPVVNDFLRLAAWARDVGVRKLAGKA